MSKKNSKTSKNREKWSKIFKKLQKCRKTGTKPFKISKKRQKRRKIRKKRSKKLKKRQKCRKTPRKPFKFYKNN